VLCGEKPGFPTTETKFKVKRRMECGWVKAKTPLENPGNLAEDSLKSLENISFCCWPP